MHIRRAVIAERAHTHNTRREAVGMRANEALARLAGTDLPELRSR